MNKEDAEIVIVSHALGHNHRTMLFDIAFGEVGISASECLILSMSEGPEEVATRIQEYPRKVICAVGEEALGFLTAEGGINKWRGSVLYDIRGQYGDVWDCPIVPMLHPSQILKQYTWLQLLKLDASRAKAILNGQEIKAPDLDITQVAGLKRKHDGSLLEAFGELKETLETYVDVPCLAFDIETYRGTITCVGLAKSKTEAVVVPLTGEFSDRQTAELLELVREALQGPALKVGQNLDYDVQYLAKCFNIGVRNVWMDTMVAHSNMHPEMAHSLDFLTSVYTYHPYYKEMRKEATSGNYSELLWEYNGIDCCITYEVACELMEELLDTGVDRFFQDCSMPATKTLIRMEYKGVLIDDDLRNSRRGELQKDIDEILLNPVLEGVNPNSPKQVQEWFSSVGIKLPTPRGRKSPSTDETSLRLTAAKYPPARSFISAILEARGKRKIISTYLNAECHDDGRMRTSYRTSATDTGRISSSSDVFNKGMNLQNVPKSQRDWFIPDPGKVFWACDASQIEARITAFLSGDRRYCEAFLEGGRDLHSENASRLFGRAIDKTTRIPGTDKYYRDVGKMATHAMNYMIGPVNLQRTISADFPELNFTVSQARKFIATFEELFPGVVRWWRRIIAHLRTVRVVVTPFGRRRVFLGRYNDQLHKAAIAYLPQSTAADHINLSLVNIERRLLDIPGSDVLLQTHDEIAGQCFPEDLERLKKVVVEEMEMPLPISYKGQPLIVPADFESGPSWKDCK